MRNSYPILSLCFLTIILCSFSMNNKHIEKKQLMHTNDDFSNFLNNFQLLKLPLNTYKLDSIAKSPSSRELKISKINDLLIFSPNEPAFCIYGINNKKRCEHFGKYSDAIYEGNFRKNNIIYKDTAITPTLKAIGRLNLSNDYISLIIRHETYEVLTYDIWNFSKKGNRLSMLSLFWGEYMNADFITEESTILPDNKILWKQNTFDMEKFKKLIIYRTYKLNKDGYFEVIEERKEFVNK